MKIKRGGEMCELERAVMQMIFKDVANTPDDGAWRKYEKGFIYEGSNYRVKCVFRVSNQYLTHKNLVISHDTQLIQIPQGSHLH